MEIKREMEYFSKSQVRLLFIMTNRNYSTGRAAAAS